MIMKKTYIIAELGVNHNGSLDLAKKLIDAAVNCEADAVKFQSFCAESLVIDAAPKAAYQNRNDPRFASQFELLKSLELNFSGQAQLAQYAAEKKIEFLSSAFDLESLLFLNQTIGVTKFKIGSGEISNLPFLFEHAKLGKAILLSTGMSTLEEIDLALSVLALGYCCPGETSPSLAKAKAIYGKEEAKKRLRENVTLLHCTSNYPAHLNEINLNAMETMQQGFNLNVGYSDHSLSAIVPIAAVAKGACVIEKHLTLDTGMQGPDHKASLCPQQFKAMVCDIRTTELLLGSSEKYPVPSELETRLVARKSLVAAKAINAGELFDKNNLTIKRPGTGLAPAFYWKLIGLQARKSYSPDELIEEEVCQKV